MIWRSIPSAPGYEASDAGLIRNARTGRVLSPSRAGEGYWGIKLGRARRDYVHRLVLEAFVGPCPEGMEARHLDGDRGNNRADNLAWGTRSENREDARRHSTLPLGERHYAARVTEAEVRAIRAWPRYAHGLSRMFPHIKRDAIVAIRTRRNWRHVGG